jgi:phosphoribosylamine---glycine ligase
MKSSTDKDKNSKFSTQHSTLQSSMNILVIGSGGREHALAKKLAEHPNARIYAAPGNSGIFTIAEAARLGEQRLNTSNHADVKAFCHAAAIDLVVIGPEAPLAAGLADDLRASNIAVFGPSRIAAQLESSKRFAKDFMLRNGIPTAQYRTFDDENHAEACEYVAAHTLPVVIKADGLAAGKGVTVATTHSEALSALEAIFKGKFGAAGRSVVVEEFMQGEEASLFAISDGERFITLAAAQDHKRIGDGDTGENTGGMGAYAPAPLVTPAIMRDVEERVIAPTVHAMKREGMPFVGCLFVGLMIDASGTARVVEFNARFGDPETQVICAVFDGDMAQLLMSAALGKLDASAVQNAVRNVASGVACCVVLAAGGYPGEVRRGDEITGIAEAEATGASVFHAGTDVQHEHLCTNGGRVLGVTARGETLPEAIERSYEAASKIHFRGKTFRTDIGRKGLGKG